MELQRAIRYALSLALVLVFLLHVGGKLPIPILDTMENLAYDTRLKLTLPDSVDKRVVIVDIDEKSLGELGRWPWNRDIMASINETLFDHYGVLTLGYDITFAEQDIDAGATLLEKMAEGSLSDNEEFIAEYESVIASLQRDAIFAESLADRKTIMGFIMDTGSFIGELPPPVARLPKELKDRIPLIQPKGYTANLPELQKNAYGGGFFDNPLLDEDGIFRRVPLIQNYDGQLHESLALAVARVALGSPRIELVVESERDDGTGDLFLEAVKIGETLIPVGDNAGVLVPYIGLQRSFDYIPAADVYNRTVEPERLKGKIALFGASAPGLLDLRTTPLQPAYPGVEVHANITQGILDERVMHKPGYTLGLEFVLLAVLGLSLTAVLPMLSAIWGTTVTALTLAVLIFTNMLAWNGYQLVLPIATPVLLTVLLFTLQMTYGFFVESRGKRQLAHLFGQYVPPELVDEMSCHMDEITTDGEIRNMTVLFSDVRSFTTISENTEPKELTELINGFLTPITKVIHDERGTIDKYMGDAVMAFWGAPLEDDQHALHALQASIKMIARMEELRPEFQARGWPEIKIGVGVNTGEMNVGNKGSEFRVDYTVLGDPVNLGSRLEGLTKQYGVDIICGEATRHEVPEFEYRELDRVRVKGKDKPVAIYEPLGLLETVEKSVRQELKRFHMALKHYRAQHWDEAEMEIFNLSQRDPDRLIYKIYLDRIQHYRNNPPDEGWDGSFTHTTK